jgi:DNA-binding GntR family transcriptional regulator
MGDTVSTAVAFRGIDVIERESMADKAIDRLLLAIASGELPQGARLIEGEIAEKLGVSRVPVREAMQSLALHGVLERAGPRGFRVAAFDEEHMREVYELRFELEALMMRRAMPLLAADPDLVRPLDVQIEAMTAAAEAGDAIATNRADLAFHRHVLRTSGHRLGMKAWEGISRHVQIIFAMEFYRNPDFRAIREQHVTLKTVLLSGDVASLEAVLAEHISGHRSLIVR